MGDGARPALGRVARIRAPGARGRSGPRRPPAGAGHRPHPPKPHPHRPGPDLALGPDSSGNRVEGCGAPEGHRARFRVDPVDVVGPRAARSTESPIDGNVADRSRAVFHLRGPVRRSPGVCSTLGAASVTSSLSAILLSPFGLSPSFGRSRARTGSPGRRSERPPCFRASHVTQALPVFHSVGHRRGMRGGGSLTSSLIPAGRPLRRWGRENSSLS